MTRSLAALAAAATALALPAVLVTPQPAGAAQARTIEWGDCAATGLTGPADLRCGEVEADLVPGRPGRGTVTLAAARLPATGPAGERAGTLVVHPGGPGAVGRALLVSLAATAPAELRAKYDLVAYDPRGTGASTPSLSCDPGFWNPPAPDPVPAGARAERELLRRATGYAADCARNGGPLLAHMSTRDHAADLEALRVALGESRMSFAGYGYGGYLGAAWATLYPGSRDRLVLDSSMRPDSDVYRHYLDQDRAMDDVAHRLFAWAARHDAAYGIGDTEEEVAAVYRALREELAGAPAQGVTGPYELEALVINATWDDRYWPIIADVLSAYAVRGDTSLAALAYDMFAREEGDNRYASFLATSCADGTWPRSWRRWHRDKTAMHAEAPFAAWNNAWHLAPCARWPQRGGQAVRIDGAAVGEALLLHATEGGGMPYEGGAAMHRALPASRLVVQEGGVNHALSLVRGDACADRAVLDYLLDGELPADAGRGPDLVCPPGPEPQPPVAGAALRAPATGTPAIR
ncbi:alpha/beta fold hydrolase [Streptomyces sp. NPDC013181]|uniref:alpha/beta fold hydrolase n=1 Tax=Streptomyces sp. NPDC013181 TaxID=3364864 RepID=UPI0036853369